MEPRSLLLTCVGSHTSREIKNVTISEFSTSRKKSRSREQFLLRLTAFYPIYGYRLNFFNFYGYRLNFWPFYAYRLTPLRPSYYRCLFLGGGGDSNLLLVHLQLKHRRNVFFPIRMLEKITLQGRSVAIRLTDKSVSIFKETIKTQKRIE